MLHDLSRAMPYAKAIFAIAEESNSYDVWSQALTFISAIASEKNIVALAEDPRLSKDHLVAILRDIAKEKFPEGIWQLIRLLLRKKNFALIPSVALVYEKLRAKYEGKIEIRVVSARPLSQDQQRRLSLALQKRLRKSVVLLLRTDATLLGGLVLRIDDRIIDASLRAMLQKISFQAGS